MPKTFIKKVWAKNAKEAQQSLERRGYVVISVEWLKSYGRKGKERRYKLRVRRFSPLRGW